MRWFILTLAALLPPVVLAAAPELPVASVHARYVVIKNGIEIIEIDETYTRNNDRYTLSSTARPLGLLALFKPQKIFIQSQGLINTQGLKPLRFSYQYQENSHKDSQADFVWEKQQLKLNHDGLHNSVDLPRGTQDRLSAMYQFMFLDLRDQRSLAFAMTNGSKLDNYRYTISTGQDINTQAGRFKTLYLDSPAKAGETRTEVWLATARHNLPCKLVITDPEGGKLTQELRRLDILP